MMLSRRLPSKGPAPQPGSVSPAQFQTAVESYHPLRQPANRLVKPLMTSDDYSLFENTSRRGRRSNDVTFPPVHRAPLKSYGNPRRSAKRGPHSNLPNMKGKGGNHRRIAWYHEDGSINLEALNLLGQHRQSFPRSQSYYERLHKMNTNKSWPQGAQQQLMHDENLMPLLLNDDELTPRRRAERDSFLAALLKADDLTEEELDELAQYFLPGDSEAESAEPAASCMKSSPRSKANTQKKKKKTVKSKAGQGTVSPNQSPRSKSVRFLQSSPLSGVSENTSPRPQSSVAQYRSEPKPSDPFHVASPRSVDSDDTAYLCDLESPPENPASPELIPQPKVTYFDDEGEEIEEEIFQEHKEREGDHEKGRSFKREASSQWNSESSRSESDRRRLSPVPESDPSTSEHLPDLDTPRVNRETEPTKASPRSSHVSDDSPRPQGLSDSSDSPRQSSGARSSATQKETSSQSTEKEPNDGAKGDENQLNSSLTRQVLSTRASVETSTQSAEDHSDQQSKKSRPKSAKRGRKSNSRPQPVPQDDGSASETENAERTKLLLQSGPPEDALHDTAVSPSRAATSYEEEEPPPIPVISLTRGQLSSVPSRPPRIETADTQLLDSAKAQPSEGTGASESLQVEFSPRSSTLAGGDSGSSDGSKTNPKKKSRKKDNRMKIWLTRTAWNRPAEIAVE
ncbi:serine-rich adhesin for platelets-like [Littorina saxatilis]|uniref:Uncharacterized protein n=1 Tax=Littorina saxatilis TaxID=31220 RepID=A0AAN9BDR3_9CAEN